MLLLAVVVLLVVGIVVYLFAANPQAGPAAKVSELGRLTYFAALLALLLFFLRVGV